MGDDCPNSKPAAVETVKKTETENGVASKAMATGLLGLATPAINIINTGTGAANEILKTVQPMIANIISLRTKINSLTQLPDLEANQNLLEGANKKMFIQTSETLIKNANEEIEINPDNLEQIITKLNTALESLYDKLLNPSKQDGGKKIISRTHKSINQFLNPKITAANIKSKRKRNAKSGYKSKKRTRY